MARTLALVAAGCLLSAAPSCGLHHCPTPIPRTVRVLGEYGLHQPSLRKDVEAPSRLRGGSGTLPSLFNNPVRVHLSTYRARMANFGKHLRMQLYGCLPLVKGELFNLYLAHLTKWNVSSARSNELLVQAPMMSCRHSHRAGRSVFMILAAYAAVYYVNHIEKTTQWDRPAAVPAYPPAAPAASLPSAVRIMDGGIVKGFVQNYNTKILDSYGGGRAQIDAAKGKGLSDVIEIALRPRAPDQGRAVLGDVLALAPYHVAFGLAIVAASLPNAVGLTRVFPGLSLLLGVSPVVLALEVGLGFDRPWLPGALLNLKLGGTSLGSVSLSLVAPMCRSFEQVLKPRVSFVVNLLGRLPTSLVLFLLSVPFGGQLKALAMVVMGLGMLTRDGLLYLGAWVFVLLTFGVIKFVALCAAVGLAMVYAPNR